MKIKKHMLQLYLDIQFNERMSQYDAALRKILEDYVLEQIAPDLQRIAELDKEYEPVRESIATLQELHEAFKQTVKDHDLFTMYDRSRFNWGVQADTTLIGYIVSTSTDTLHDQLITTELCGITRKNTTYATKNYYHKPTDKPINESMTLLHEQLQQQHRAFEPIIELMAFASGIVNSRTTADNGLKVLVQKNIIDQDQFSRWFHERYTAEHNPKSYVAERAKQRIIERIGVVLP